MASGSAPLAAPKRRRMPTQAKKAQTHRGSISKATTLRRSPRFTSAVENPSQETNNRRSLRLQGADPIQTAPASVQQAKTPKRSRKEGGVPPSRSSPKPLLKRVQTSTASVDEQVAREISEARDDYWRETGTWPTEEQEKIMKSYRDFVQHQLARKRASASLRRKRSDASINAETVPTPTPSDQQPREQKSAPYKHPWYQGQLGERGSFVGTYEERIVAVSKEICQKLLGASQAPPGHPELAFLDDDLFNEALDIIKGGNETRVMRDIA
ncbi:hypothetical protein N0V90_012842 [Kalmusia sp. IMI 367209]|nr:hypothetical protein N0V90_012842 [Kalmusia sp. IMI 367209]